MAEQGFCAFARLEAPGGPGGDMGLDPIVQVLIVGV